MTMLVMLTDRGHILLQKKEDILSVLSNPSLEKRGVCTLTLVMSFGISKEPILMIPRVAAGGSTTSSFLTPHCILRLEMDLNSWTVPVNHVIQSI